LNISWKSQLDRIRAKHDERIGGVAVLEKFWIYLGSFFTPVVRRASFSRLGPTQDVRGIAHVGSRLATQLTLVC
jgi:hypothetical protein